MVQALSSVLYCSVPCPDLSSVYRQLLELYPGQDRVNISSRVQGDSVVASVKVQVETGTVREWRGRGNCKKTAVLAACKQAVRAARA